eukprot:668098-Pyramimonas_sp.AAC.1
MRNSSPRRKKASPDILPQLVLEADRGAVLRFSQKCYQRPPSPKLRGNIRKPFLTQDQVQGQDLPLESLGPSKILGPSISMYVTDTAHLQLRIVQPLLPRIQEINRVVSLIPRPHPML